MKTINSLFSHLIILILPIVGIVNAEEPCVQQLCPQEGSTNKLELPGQFRRTDLHSLKEKVARGLEKLNASASRQFSENNLKYLIQELQQANILIVDLRREYHGFQEGRVVAWTAKEPINDEKYEYNHKLSAEQIEKREQIFIEKLTKNSNGDGSRKILTERQLAEQLGVDYLRIPVMDHCIPTDEQIDFFVSLITSRSPETWIHFHCAGGMGRTTTFMSMLDMMHNASSFSAYEIMQRQQALGGSNVWDPQTYEGQHPSKIVRAFERVKLLCLFHHYCLENPTFSTSWSKWLSQQTFERA